MLRSTMRRLAGGQKRPARKPTFRPHVEALERRDLMSASAGLQTVPVTGLGVVKGYTSPTAAGLAIINGLADTPVRAAALADYQRDGYLSRNDMLDILNKGTAGYTSATPAEFASLQALVSNGPTVAMPSYVQNLASKTLVGGNDELQAEIKGMKEDGVSQVVLQRFLAREPATLAQDIRQEVNDWFLGQVHPDASYVEANGNTFTPAYQDGAGLPLFGGSPSYKDVAQGKEGDCCLLASLAEVAARNPGDIESMFIDNGDGTYTVRFYNGSTPDYVTVDTYLPDAGYFYDQPQNNLWAALAEKAYAQENGAGWVGSYHPGVDSYQALYAVTPQWALSAITGLAPSSTTYTNANSVMNAWFQGSFVVLCTGDHPSSSQVVPDHCYAVLNYSAAGFTLFNPWGIHNAQSGPYPGLINLTCPALEANFTSWAQAGAEAAPLHVPPLTPIQFKYQSLGGASGILGQAVTGEVPYLGGLVEQYQNGFIFWSASTGAHDVYGPFMNELILTIGEKDAYGNRVLTGLGLPTTDVEALGSVPGAEDVVFQNGAMYWSAGTGVHVIYGGIYAEYLATQNERDAHGNEVFTLLGLPTGDETNVPGVAGGRVETFAGGAAIYWSQATGAHVVYGAIATKYNSLVGGAAVYGLPTSDEADVPGLPGARVTNFSQSENCAIYWSAATGAHVLYSGWQTDYLATAGETDYYGHNVRALLGAPTSDVTGIPGVPGAGVATFQGGNIYGSVATGAHVVYGAILTEYLSLGGPTSSLGLPTTDELGLAAQGSFPAERISYFEHGWISWNPERGAYVVVA